MRIGLFLNKDLEANLAYNLLKEELSKHTVCIYYSEAVGNPNNKPSDLLKLEYFEKTFIYNELAEFLIENKIESSFEFFDKNFKSAPIKKCVSVNSPEFIKELKDFEPDLFISVRFGKIFKNEIINIPKKGLLNLHSGILPDYRGIMGTLHAIKNKRNKIGCTLHTITDSGIDMGEIIEISEIKVSSERSLFWHIIKLYPLGSELIINALRVIQSGGSLEIEKQNLNKGNYFSIPTENDFEEIKRLGFKIISAQDYIDVLTEFVLKELTNKEKFQLAAYINSI